MSPKLQATSQAHKERVNGHDHVDGNGDGFGGDRGPSGGGPLPIPTPKLALWLFLIAPTLMFSALASAYVVRMGWPDWGALPTPWTLWLNTGVLIASSAAIQLASLNARRGSAFALRTWRWFYAAGVLGGLFIVGQLAAWARLWGLGIGMAGNPSASFFYLITAIHGAHLVGGLVAWIWTERRARRVASPEQTALRVQVCAQYGHFLLAVWLVMFGLMELTV